MDGKRIGKSVGITSVCLLVGLLLCITTLMQSVIAEPEDTAPPVPITDLTVNRSGYDTTLLTSWISLNWTAPGDDGNVGTASEYDVRYSTSPITEDNWSDAIQCEGEPTPKPAGSRETFKITGLARGTIYYFALKTADEVPNWAALSNVISGGYGAVVGEYNGVTAYSNGGNCYYSQDNNIVDGYNCGMKWQCVEYVNRYYFIVYGLQIRNQGGNANQYYDTAENRGLIPYKNGEAISPPQPGDILCSNGKPWGHVAIVRRVTDSEVHVIHQNWANTKDDNDKTLMLTVSDGKYKVSHFGTGYPVQGWLRVPFCNANEAGTPTDQTAWLFNGESLEGWGICGIEGAPYYHTDGWLGFNPVYQSDPPGDPRLFSPLINKDPVDLNYVEFRVKTKESDNDYQPVEEGKVYLRTELQGYSENNMQLFDFKTDGEWNAVKVRLDNIPAWREARDQGKKITGVRIDFVENGTTGGNDDIYVDYIFFRSDCYEAPIEVTPNAKAISGSVCEKTFQQYHFPVIADGRTYTVTVTPVSGNPDLYASRKQEDIDNLSDILHWDQTCPLGSDYCASSTNPGQVSELVTFTAPTDGDNYEHWFSVYGKDGDDHGMVRYKVRVTYTTQEQGLADVALILDSSGSMSWNDPLNVRHAAARYFVDLAYADALAGASKMQVAIVDFDSYARTWAHLTMVDNQANRDLLWNAIGMVNSLGGTNLERGLDQGYSELNASSYPSVPKAGVMLTDGQGSYYDGAVQYANRGWDVYTLGLSNEVNQDLLYAIAHTTEHGEYYTCTTENMQTVYNKIKAQITGGSILATFLGFINQGQQVWNSLPVSEGLSSLQVSANWQGSQLQLTLVDPNGQIIDPDEAAIDPTISYAQSNTYSMYTIVNPEAGEWQTCITGVNVPAGGEAYTTIASVKSPVLSNFLPFEPSYSVGDSLSIGVYFGEETTPGHYEDITDLSVSATVYRPDGATANLTLYDDGLHNDRQANDGRYANIYRNLNFNGSYLVRVKAEENGAALRTLQETIQVGSRNAVYISGAGLLPEPGSTTEDLTPLIKATIWGPAANIDETTIDLRLDGATVAHNWDEVNQIVSYVPSSPLSGQRHIVELSLRDATGHPVIPVSWSFDVLASDLSVKASTIKPSRPFPGDTLIFSAVVHCDSAVLPLDSVKVGFYDGDPDSGGIEFAEKTVHGFSTGDFDTVKASWIFAHPICGYLYVKVDPGNVIKEWDETDNQKPVLVLPSLPSTVEFVPDRLDLTPGHPPVKCYIELPIGYQVKGIDEVTLSGCTSEHIDPLPDPWKISDYDEDGNPDLMVTFDWLATLRTVDPRTCGVATIRGSVMAPEPFQDSLLTFQGRDTITVGGSDFGGCISGLVSTADTQEPISGVTVQILKDTLIVGKDTTNANGRYSISYVLPDIYEVLASKKGLGTMSQPNVESIEAETTVVNFQFPSVGVAGEKEAKIPKVFSLSQNYPNPFNPVTTIRYGLPEEVYIELSIYNISGQQVAILVNEMQQAGYHQVSWDGKGVASGIYFYRIQAGQFTQTRKMILLR